MPSPIDNEHARRSSFLIHVHVTFLAVTGVKLQQLLAAEGLL